MVLFEKDRKNGQKRTQPLKCIFRNKITEKFTKIKYNFRRRNFETDATITEYSPT